MVTVEFLGPIAKEPLQVEAKNLREVAQILQKDSEIKKWLGECAVAVNDKIVKTLDIELKDGDKVSLLPPVCGG
ncbi:MoaD/ThiS family protein [Nitratiruptor tergarcus]|uniref:Molybdopterin synthase sulfur carrier subunit n=1 Tax=Nitratiruptor tergarcus DSM 16512 TaxID=1069081 RepID=A0A1W1WQB8_9BACT|nr:MoaD/ThiS family protein [Nitratiruptor tergarcus]SMC08487.1 molybdopterin synthase sulfur carrier subunit [Nitratiruptor tergarcus DSM 16512]